MNKLKKSLSVLLTLVMLFTTLCFFVLPETGIKANAAAGASVSVGSSSYNRVDDVIITVPETIYMTPSSGNSKTGQYYVNNVVDSTGKVSLEKSNAATAGRIGIYAPGAVKFAINVVKSVGDYGEPVIGGTDGTATYENQPFDISNGHFDFAALKLTLDGAGMSSGTVASIKWEITLTYSDGNAVTYYAFSTLYSPYFQPVGAAAEAWSGKGVSDSYQAWLGSILWVEGVHSVSASNYSGAAAWYPRTDNFIPMAGAYKDSGFNNNRPSTHWIQSGTNNLDASVTYFEGNDGKNHERVNVVSPLANITVDTSRYANFNQIPNFKIGYMITDSENTDDGKYYVADYTDYNFENSNGDGKDLGSYRNGGSEKDRREAYYNAPHGTLIASGSEQSCTVKYRGVWNRAVTSGTQTIKGAAGANETNGGTKRSAWNNNFVQINVTSVDKTELRNLVLQGTSINKLNYVNNGFDWYIQGLENAAYVLGNPCATQADVNNAVARIKTTIKGGTDSALGACPGLQITVSAFQNHNASDGTCLEVKTFVIGTGVSVSYTPPKPADRAGYNFVGWNTDRNATTGGAESFNVSLYDKEKKVYAIWTIKQYTMDFNTMGGSAIPSVTKNYGEQVARPADPTKTGYTFAGWDGVTFPHTLLNNITAVAKWNINQYKITFNTLGGTEVKEIVQDYNTAIADITAPTKTGYIFTGWNPALPETMPANNLTVSAVWQAKPYTITYDLNDEGVNDAVMGDADTSYTIESVLTLPTVTSTNYNFSGWKVTVTDDEGNWVESTVYPAGHTLRNVYGNVTLEAQWAIKKFTVNWVNWNGIIIETDSVDYGARPSFNGNTPVKPADAEFTYNFTGWDGNVNAGITADTTFTAQFSSTRNSYTVTWYDFDGTKLAEQTYLYGETPVFPLDAPERTDPDGRLTYTFKGWTPAIGAVEGNTSYTAEYDSTVNTYDISFTYRDVNGTEKTVEIADVEHGTGFNSLIPDDFAEFYKGASTGFTHSHYKASWTNATEAITGAEDFVAEYTLISNVTMTFTDDYRSSDCENEGLDSRACADCDYVYEEAIPVKGHDWKETGDSATCLEDGETFYKCSRCNGTKSEPSYAHGHSFYTAEKAVAVTCTTDGMASYKQCSYCELYFAADATNTSADGKNDTSSFVIRAEGHKFTLTAKEEASCTENGHEAYYTCSECKLYFAADADAMTATGTADIEVFTITKLGHAYTAEVTPPNCTEDGYTTHTCSRCGDTYKDTIVKAEGHEAGEPVVEDRSEDATCTNPGSYKLVTYCTVCGEKLSSVPMTAIVPHTYAEIIVPGLEGQLKAAKTCYSFAEYYKVCSMCNTAMSAETFLDENGGKLAHTPGEIVKIPTVTATCTINAEWDEVRYCTVEECKAITHSEHKVGTTNPDNHADHKTTTTVSNEVPGTCTTERTWTETITCNGCTKVLSVTDKTGNKNVLNHTGEAEGEAYIDTAGTCMTEAVWRVDTICSACNEKTKTRTYKGEKNPEKHTGGNDVKIENSVEATCITADTWQVVTYCLGCTAQLSRINKTGSVNPDRHVGETYTQEENTAPGTCTTEKTWDEVTYCADCNKAVSTASHTGDKNPLNHSGATELRGNKEATCGAEGYTGDLYWDCCDELEAEGETIPMLEEHTPAEPVRENEIFATETTDGEYDSVVYCSVCGHEISREHVVHRIERTIKFVLKDKTIVVKAFSGDTVVAPETPEVQTADGFWHYFMGWDKKIKPVTGDATYTAIYTEPCDYSELERLEAQLKEILADGSVSEEVQEANKEKIEATLEEIRKIYLDRNYRDVSEQDEITAVTDKVEALIQVICPDLGSVLVIEGSVVQYTGRTLALRAVKMPSGSEVFDAEWTSSDDSIVFFANGKLYAIGTGTVTITAKRGVLKASVTITIVEGGNSRGINFTSVDNASFILEESYQAKDGAIVYWADDQPIRFRVHVSSSFLYESYYVYINGEAAETDKDGYYTIPANSGDVKVTIAGEMIDTGAGKGETVTKWSFWDWLVNFFRKIGDFFRGLFS